MIALAVATAVMAAATVELARGDTEATNDRAGAQLAGAVGEPA